MALTLGPVAYRDLRRSVTPWPYPTFLAMVEEGFVVEVEGISVKTIQITQLGVDFLVFSTIECV